MILSLQLMIASATAPVDKIAGWPYIVLHVGTVSDTFSAYLLFLRIVWHGPSLNNYICMCIVSMYSALLDMTVFHER